MGRVQEDGPPGEGYPRSKLFRVSLLRLSQSVGQIIGDVLRQLDDERFIVKASSGPRYVVGCRNKLDKAKLKAGTRVSLDMTTLTIMRQLPREVDPNVYHMLHEDAGGIPFSAIGGTSGRTHCLGEFGGFRAHENPTFWFHGTQV